MTRRQAEQIVKDQEEEALFMDGFDGAIVGVGRQATGPLMVIYDREKCIKILMKRDKMSREGAEEYFSFNSEGAWVGPGTPAIVET